MFDGAKCWTYRPTLPQGSESPHTVRRLRPLCGIWIKSFGTRFFPAPLCGDSDPCGDPDPRGDPHPSGILQRHIELAWRERSTLSMNYMQWTSNDPRSGLSRSLMPDFEMCPSMHTCSEVHDGYVLPCPLHLSIYIYIGQCFGSYTAVFKYVTLPAQCAWYTSTRSPCRCFLSFTTSYHKDDVFFQIFPSTKVHFSPGI